MFITVTNHSEDSVPLQVGEAGLARSKKMKHLLLLLASIAIASCFPTTYTERPAIEVRVIDSHSSKKIESARVIYRELNPFPDACEHTTNRDPEIYPVTKGTVRIPKKTSLGAFWLMQQPLPLFYSLTAEAPGYVSSMIKRKLFTHGPFSSDQDTHSIEAIRLNPR